MLAKETLDFLRKLDENNDREWFQANKKAFDAAQDNMTAFAGYLIGEIGNLTTLSRISTRNRAFFASIATFDFQRTRARTK